MSKKFTVVFDFDGVIHSYTSGWKGVDVIPDPPVAGIREAIAEIRKQYRVVVVSSRFRDEKGMQATIKWLEKNDIIVDDLSIEKQPALVYIDDRALTFDGNAAALLEKIKYFKPWHKQKR